MDYYLLSTEYDSFNDHFTRSQGSVKLSPPLPWNGRDDLSCLPTYTPALYSRQISLPRRRRLRLAVLHRRELHETRQHRRYARYLLLLVHRDVVRRVGFEVDGDALGDERQQRQQIVTSAVLPELQAESLHEPGAPGCVAPRVEARHRRVGDQKVRVRRYAERDGRVAVGLGALLHRDAAVEPVALAGLDEKELGLAGERGASVGREVRPDRVGLVGRVVGVEEAQLAVAQDRDDQAVVLRVVHFGDWKHRG